MDWHIITSSKGGVGKTLVALLLLAYYRFHRKSVFVIDLNGMNPDLRRLVCDQHNSSLFHGFTVECGGEKIDFLRYRVEFSELGTQYVIAWPANPYKMLCSSMTFICFLENILDKSSFPLEGKRHFQPDTIIIDTNSHFCNIFPNDDEQYQNCKSLFKQGSSENFFIWFIWIYRQLRNIWSDQPEHTPELQIQEKIINAIERNIQEPFVHIFNATNVASIVNPRGNFFTKMIEKNQDMCEIRQLKSLITEKVGKPANFKTVLEGLEQAYKPVSKKYPDVHDIFLALLEKYAEGKKDTGCPSNIIPLPNFHRGLTAYSDADFDPETLIDGLQKLDIFTNFSTSLNRLLNNRK